MLRYFAKESPQLLQDFLIPRLFPDLGTPKRQLWMVMHELIILALSHQSSRECDRVFGAIHGTVYLQILLYNHDAPYRKTLFLHGKVPVNQILPCRISCQGIRAWTLLLHIQSLLPYCFAHCFHKITYLRTASAWDISPNSASDSASSISSVEYSFCFTEGEDMFGYDQLWWEVKPSICISGTWSLKQLLWTTAVFLQ